jgi:hypothetical protein
MNFPSKDTAEIAQAVVTSVALVVGGLWAFWRWSLSEYLRRKREIPSFEGVLSHSIAVLDDRRVVVSLNCRWKNVGVVPLPVNTQETRFSIYGIPDASPLGPIGPRMKNLTELHVRRPWEHWPGAVLEPGTNSDLQAHFLLEAGHTFVAMCRLEAKTPASAQKQVWVREVVFQSRSAPVPRGDASQETPPK